MNAFSLMTRYPILKPLANLAFMLFTSTPLLNCACRCELLRSNITRPRRRVPQSGKQSPNEGHIIMKLQQSMLEAIEAELKNQVARLDQPHTKEFHEMLTYHMGWTGEGAGSHATGKRIRPLITLLSTASIDNKEKNSSLEVIWLHAISAASSIELIHNFSLVHDDIQDNSELRRGRKTVWVKWGSPMAINAGDALFVIAYQSILDLSKHYPPEIVV